MRRIGWLLGLVVLLLVAVVPAFAGAGSGTLSLSCENGVVQASWDTSYGPASVTLTKVSGPSGPGEYAGLPENGSQLTNWTNGVYTIELVDPSYPLILSTQTIVCFGTLSAVTVIRPAFTDGRINNNHGDKIAIFPIRDEDDYGVEVWLTDKRTVPVLLLAISAEELSKLPEKTAENLLIAQSEDGLVQVYKLTTGEFQVNYGPDGDGKIFVFRFKTFSAGMYEFEVIEKP